MSLPVGVSKGSAREVPIEVLVVMLEPPTLQFSHKSEPPPTIRNSSTSPTADNPSARRNRRFFSLSAV
jgi:hypothetical protein